jgi:glutathione S-transferase
MQNDAISALPSQIRMSLILYEAPFSTAAVTVDVLAELAIPFERLTVNVGVGDTRRPEFPKLNPNGKVPTLVHEGTAMWESAAITMYLGETFGVKAGLYPPSGKLRGEAMKWIVWTNVSLMTANAKVMALLPQESDKGKADEHKEKKGDILPSQLSFLYLDNAKAELAGFVSALDNALAGKCFLLGDFTLVDTHLNSFMEWILMVQVWLKPSPEMKAWMERCQSRPAIVAVRKARNVYI